jgi:hypothetical protein
MSRRAFWPKEGVRRQIPGLVQGEMLDAEITDNGVKFFKRGGQTCEFYSGWDEIFKTSNFAGTLKFKPAEVK